MDRMDRRDDGSVADLDRCGAVTVKQATAIDSRFRRQYGLRLWGDPGFTEAVGVVGAELGEGLVGRAVVVGGGGGDEVQLGTEVEQVLGLLLRVGGIEG